MLRLGCLGLLIFPLWVNAAADDLELLGGELNLHGRIIDQPCVVAPESLEQEVEMGVVDVKQLYANGAGEQVPFSIRLTNCKPGIFRMAKVTFTGSKDTQLSGGLAFTAGIAKGAGIRLYDVTQTPLDLGTPSRGYLLGGSADNELQFFARVEGHPDALAAKNIQPGDYSAVANFIVAYE
ncbi:type 1 fimbrial protein [Aeromonas hydrophila]|jgi:type 1 fimbria pilin|uniref:fimbrial protein n=1 Tax=Aeromonas TaxID=642 RepID=UPI00148AEDC7|nr:MULTISPECIES: fimbrial protein [Aeromonas]MBL0434251.1 type 1 fimbrial protein [Aeromonas hydrophila]MBL0470200.1 type 1 fimbrial protein [Aeromonas hydrophila]QJT17561.1 type 1 fimbrial protein [Aeromonas sp. 1805]